MRPPPVRPDPIITHEPTSQQTSQARQRHIHQARVLRGMASVSQVVVILALYVLWRQVGLGFWRSLELCLVGGVIIYVALFGVAALLLVISRLEPLSLLVGPAIRLISIAIYATLRYGQHVHVIKSIAIVLVLQIAAWLLVRRIERRARRHFGW